MRVWGLGFAMGAEASSLGFGVCSGFRIEGSGCGIQGFKV